jgi:hypothetical protein
MSQTPDFGVSAICSSPLVSSKLRTRSAAYNLQAAHHQRLSATPPPTFIFSSPTYLFFIHIHDNFSSSIYPSTPAHRNGVPPPPPAAQASLDNVTVTAGEPSTSLSH